MGSFEQLPGKQHEADPVLASVLEQYGDVLVMNHKEGGYLPLSQAVDPDSTNYCPPFVHALLNATPEQLPQIIDAIKAPE